MLNIESDSEEHIATLTLNRPERRNALSMELMQQLTCALEDIGQRSDISVVVLQAAGKVFSSGHDLGELVDRSAREYQAIFDQCTRLMTTIQHIPQPVIAMVRGVATAAGCQLVATCDLAFADDAASFGTPGVKIGLFCSTPMVAVSRAIGRKRALQLLLTGERIDARTAADWGLINAAVPADQLEEHTRTIARQIVAASPLIVGVGKRAFYAQIDMDQHAAYAHTGDVMTMNALMADAHEGITAFLTKREPHWAGR
ncbi:MAG: enoyl-CoA hydratase [Chloroflexi bacterium]|nr:enoyl-CoA hydratase [Chloroflexota bacterium]MBV9132406.1 enoyl-CoA hydratase [Chloroflexota bacterium]MBV9897414.1 enoyl-CoA hydratase [Chloroflexota bacterium]